MPVYQVGQRVRRVRRGTRSNFALTSETPAGMEGEIRAVYETPSRNFYTVCWDDDRTTMVSHAGVELITANGEPNTPTEPAAMTPIEFSRLAPGDHVYNLHHMYYQGEVIRRARLKIHRKVNQHAAVLYIDDPRMKDISSRAVRFSRLALTTAPERVGEDPLLARARYVPLRDLPALFQPQE